MDIGNHKQWTVRQFDFPVGYHSFNNDRDMNYQLNRWHSMGYWTTEETSRAGANIQDRSDWKPGMLALATWLEEQDRHLAAAFGYRAGEAPVPSPITTILEIAEGHS